MRFSVSVGAVASSLLALGPQAAQAQNQHEPLIVPDNATVPASVVVDSINDMNEVTSEGYSKVIEAINHDPSVEVSRPGRIALDTINAMNLANVRSGSRLVQAINGSSQPLSCPDCPTCEACPPERTCNYDDDEKYKDIPLNEDERNVLYVYLEYPEIEREGGVRIMGESTTPFCHKLLDRDRSAIWDRNEDLTQTYGSQLREFGAWTLNEWKLPKQLEVHTMNNHFTIYDDRGPWDMIDDHSNVVGRCQAYTDAFYSCFDPKMGSEYYIDNVRSGRSMFRCVSEEENYRIKYFQNTAFNQRQLSSFISLPGGRLNLTNSNSEADGPLKPKSLGWKVVEGHNVTISSELPPNER